MSWMPRMLRGYIAGHSSKSMTKQRRYSIILTINIIQLRWMSWRVLRWRGGEKGVSFSLPASSHLSRVGWFSRALAFRSLWVLARLNLTLIFSHPQKNIKSDWVRVSHHWQTLVSPLNANIICPFQKYNNTLELPSKALHKHCFQLLLEPREQS